MDSAVLSEHTTVHQKHELHPLDQGKDVTLVTRLGATENLDEILVEKVIYEGNPHPVQHLESNRKGTLDIKHTVVEVDAESVEDTDAGDDFLNETRDGTNARKDTAFSKGTSSAHEEDTDKEPLGANHTSSDEDSIIINGIENMSIANHFAPFSGKNTAAEASKDHGTSSEEDGLTKNGSINNVTKGVKPSTPINPFAPSNGMIATPGPCIGRKMSSEDGGALTNGLRAASPVNPFVPSNGIIIATESHARREQSSGDEDTKKVTDGGPIGSPIETKAISPAKPSLPSDGILAPKPRTDREVYLARMYAETPKNVLQNYYDTETLFRSGPDADANASAGPGPNASQWSNGHIPDHGYNRRHRQFVNGTNPQANGPPYNGGYNGNAYTNGAHNHSNPYRDANGGINGDALTRLQVALSKAHKDLAAERATNLKLHTSLQDEIKKGMDTTLLSMIQEIFHKQVSVTQQTANLASREIDLKRRASQIEQQEIFLAAGQNLLQRRFESDGVVNASLSQQQNYERLAEIKALGRYEQLKNKLDADRQLLSHKEEEMLYRQQHWIAQNRATIESQMRAELEEELGSQIAQEEYARGFEAGKEDGRKEVSDEAMGQGFLLGYKNAQETQNKLVALRTGRLPYDDPSLDFLTNPENPEHLFNRGVQVGQATPVLENPTLYSQLMGPRPVHNGEEILANHEPNPQVRVVNGVNSVNGVNGMHGSAHGNINGPAKEDNIPNFMD
ncbi:hypothetical protein P154DRAFT_337348 [Amniculicola lignicola CBS 123094]|uniref:Uncharacterized protein n=1 Tax=Amniculicola lignicola CBS 123094 TaxID=1392246 RepID=A0A6A5WWR6_9PLEO|nr:hypothetical protein P154DRAFT_337348 [Amniculicola lignicola CBS 123094]